MATSVNNVYEILNFAGSVGWLIDRTAETEQILGTVWLVADNLVATCAIPYIPYEEIPEALIIRFPAAGSVYGVREAMFHPECDRWMSKRAISQAFFHPPSVLANQRQNLVLLRLSRSVKNLDPLALQRINRLLSRSIPKEEAGFSGRATNVELTGIIQTLVNARREGTIVICDPRKRPMARIFCRDGRIGYAKFGDSINEEAIYRLMCSAFHGYFYFQEEGRPEWCDFDPMIKSTAASLMEAYRRLEEMNAALQTIGGEAVILRKAARRPDFQTLPLDVQEAAQIVWRYLYDGMPVSSLLEVCEYDNSFIMKAIDALTNAGSVRIQPTPDAPWISPTNQPLPRSGERVPPSPGTEIFALTMTKAGLPHLASGRVICPRTTGDPWHHVHSIALPSEAVGAPIFSNGAVSGIFCGPMLRVDGEPPEYSHLQQLLWVASVESCLAGQRR